MGIDFLVYVTDTVEVTDGGGVEVHAYHHLLYEVNNLDEYEALVKILDPKHLFNPLRSYRSRTRFWSGYLNLVLVDIQEMKRLEWITLTARGRKLPCLVEGCIWDWFNATITVRRTIQVREPCDQIVAYVDMIDMGNLLIAFDYELSEYEYKDKEELCIKKIVPRYEVYFREPESHTYLVEVVTPLLRFLDENYPLITSL